MALYGMSVEEKLMTILWHVCGGEMTSMSDCTMAYLWRRNDGVMVCQWRRLNDSIWTNPWYCLNVA